LPISKKRVHLKYTTKRTQVIPISRGRVDEDIRPLSGFRGGGVVTFVKQIHEARRPMVLTQRGGRSVAVLVAVQGYERIQERLALLEEVYKAKEQIANGRGIDHEDAKSRVLGRPAEWRFFGLYWPWNVWIHSGRQALRWRVEGVFDAMARLADFPESGRIFPEVADVVLGRLYLEHIGLFTVSESRLTF